MDTSHHESEIERDSISCSSVSASACVGQADVCQPGGAAEEVLRAGQLQDRRAPRDREDIRAEGGLDWFSVFAM